MPAGAGLPRGEGRREVRRPPRFGEEEEENVGRRRSTRIPVPVRRPARGADPRSPLPAPRLSVLGESVPRVRVYRAQGGGDAAWSSEVREGANRLVAALGGEQAALSNGASAQQAAEGQDERGGRRSRLPGESQDFLNGMARELEFAAVEQQPRVRQPRGGQHVPVERQDGDGEQGNGDEEEVEERGAARLSLGPYLNPTMPAAGNGGNHLAGTDGWDLIDRLEAMECLLSPCGTLDDVPGQHEAGWRVAWVTVLQRWSLAVDDEEIDRALKWILFLPQCLLRRPRRGGKKGRSAVAARFAALTAGDWGYLVKQWQGDMRYDEERTERRRRRGEGDERKEQEKVRKQVLSLMADGQVGRALSRVTSYGAASAKDSEVQQQLKEKYPDRFRPMPDSVLRGQAVENLSGLRSALTRLQKGISPGCGGCRGEYLALLGESMEDGEMLQMEAFGMAYIQGSLPPWFYQVALTLQTVALFKTTDQDAVRPLGLAHPLMKVLHREVVNQNRNAILEYLEPQQIIMSPAGAAKLVFTVRAMLEARPDFIVVSLDIKNAYNSMTRAATVEVCESEESLRHLAQFFAVTLASPKALEAGGKVWGESPEGWAQGLSDSTAGFCIGMQPSLITLDADLKAGEGAAIAGADDVYAVGPPEVVLPASQSFKQEVGARCGLSLQLSKSRLFKWQGDLPPGTPNGLPLAGEKVNGEFFRGFMCFGCPVGEDRYVVHKLGEIADQILEDARKSAEVLKGDRQALWAGLRASMNQRFDFWCQLVRPNLVQPVAARLDQQLWKILEAAAGFPIPRAGQPLGDDDCPLIVPVQGLEARPFAEWVTRLPIKLHGAGLWKF